MAQQIRELMTPNPVALPGTASVHEAACAMRDADIGDVIVRELKIITYPRQLVGGSPDRRYRQTTFPRATVA